jgi:hypothetical protein
VCHWLTASTDHAGHDGWVPVLVIGYVFDDQPDVEEQLIVDAIKEIGPYWRFLPTGWMVASPYPVAKTCERLRFKLAEADRLVVLNATSRGGWPHGVPPFLARGSVGRVQCRFAALRPVAVEAMTTSTAAMMMDTIQRVQSTPALPLPPKAR